MFKAIYCALFFSMLLPQVTVAQDFSGTYSANETGMEIILNLTQVQGNAVIGIISFEGIEYALKGQKQGNRIAGVLNGREEKMEFSAELKQHDLNFTIHDSEETEIILFTRLESDEALHQMTREAASRKEKVVINGNALSISQINELEVIYSVKPMPGNYWYDPISGLYGVIGFSAYGFMHAGHDFGDLDANASNGDSNVFVNGRQLPQLEWLVWSQLLGYIIEPGRYWLDADGNAGYEGNLTPMENLYQAARRNAAAQQNTYSVRDGGDNMWSSRFSKGNYDQGNQRGYVSVPGYGPVGYGF